MSYAETLNLSKAAAETLDMLLDEIREFHRTNLYWPKTMDFWLSTEPAILNELLSRKVITPTQHDGEHQYYEHEINREALELEFIGHKIETIKDAIAKAGAAKRAPQARRKRRA